MNALVYYIDLKLLTFTFFGQIEQHETVASFSERTHDYGSETSTATMLNCDYDDDDNDRNATRHKVAYILSPRNEYVDDTISRCVQLVRTAVLFLYNHCRFVLFLDFLVEQDSFQDFHAKRWMPLHEGLVQAVIPFFDMVNMVPL